MGQRSRLDGETQMGYMKQLDIRIYGGGEDAIDAACELAGIAKERRAYDAVNRATGDITDIVTVLRGVGFAAVSPSAVESASLLLYCATHAADEIERLRLTPGEVAAIEAAIAYMTPVANYHSTPRDTLLGLLKRMTMAQ